MDDSAQAEDASAEVVNASAEVVDASVVPADEIAALPNRIAPLWTLRGPPSQCPAVRGGAGEGGDDSSTYDDGIDGVAVEVLEG